MPKTEYIENIPLKDIKTIRQINQLEQENFNANKNIETLREEIQNFAICDNKRINENIGLIKKYDMFKQVNVEKIETLKQLEKQNNSGEYYESNQFLLNEKQEIELENEKIEEAEKFIITNESIKNEKIDQQEYYEQELLLSM